MTVAVDNLWMSSGPCKSAQMNTLLGHTAVPRHDAGLGVRVSHANTEEKGASRISPPRYKEKTSTCDYAFCDDYPRSNCLNNLQMDTNGMISTSQALHISGPWGM